MSGIRKTLAQLGAARAKLANLLAESAGNSPRMGAESASRLRRQTPNGINPGNLSMFVYAPDHLPRKPPLVVALHGCGQTADDFDRGTGWSELADRHGFVVLYPEQQSANNPKACFSWFQPGDIGRDLGEAQSIHEMVEQTIKNFDIDRRRVSITGLSAGGAMAAVMLATYPEVYASGAIIAGLPYGSASTVQEAFEAMFNDQQPSRRALGDRVRAASRHQGSWPRVSVWHGTADKIVKPSNAENLIGQWANVHQLPIEPTRSECLGPHTRRIWDDKDGNCQIEAITIVGMGHGVPVATQHSATACGVPGPYFLDVGIPSTLHIAEYFGVGVVIDGGERAPNIEWETAMSANARAEGNARQRDNAYGRGQAGPFDPNDVIAAAFKAAGLPVPTSPSARGGVDPNAIVEATLKAAGLWRR